MIKSTFCALFFDKFLNLGNNNFDLVFRKEVVDIITTYHQLSAIDRNAKYSEVDYFVYNNHHDYEISFCEQEDDKSDNTDFL